jgi:hypothetical protein
MNSHILAVPGAISLFRGGDPSVMVITGGDITASVNQPLVAPESKDAKSQAAEPDKTGKPWAPWGDNDNWPAELLTNYIGKLGILQSGISMNADMHFGAGMIWAKDEYTDDGKIIRKPQQVEGWKQFVRDSGFEISLSENIESLETFFIAFPEFILDNGGNPVSIGCLDSSKCRFEWRDNKGRINNVYYGVAEGIDEKKVKKIPIYDPANPFKHKKFVFPIQYRCFGKLYYPEPTFWATVVAGWADIAIEIPKFIKNIYLNQITLKYLVRVPLSTIKAYYPDYDEVAPEKQFEYNKQFKQDIDDRLTGASNAGKSIISLFDDQQNMKGVEISPINNYLESKSELPNDVAANTQMCIALGLDPALQGLQLPGGGNLNGSGGSDKREGTKLRMSNMKRERIVSLQIANLYAVLKGIDPEVYPCYLDVDTSQTMDKNPTGKQTVLK